MTTQLGFEEPPAAQPTWTSLCSLLRARFIIVWILLIAATLASWYLGTDHGVNNPRLATVMVLAIAFIKLRLVGLDFMELRNAPRPLRVVFEVYCALVWSALVIVYFVEPLAPC